jgi:hypothetical protein
MKTPRPLKVIDADSRPAGDMVIPDPGDQPASKYATPPSFATQSAVTRHTPVVLGKPKTFCRSFPELAVVATLVDLARGNETGKRLHLIAPEAVADGACDNLPEAFNALLVPMVDRDGIPHLWPIRQFSRDGLQLESYDRAMIAVTATSEGWAKFFWQRNGYVVVSPMRPERLGEPKVPENLKTIDDWIEAALVGRIIRTANAQELARLVGEE